MESHLRLLQRKISAGNRDETQYKSARWLAYSSMTSEDGLTGNVRVAPSSVPVHPVQHPEVPVRPVQHPKVPVRPVLPENQEETEHQGLRYGHRSTNSKTTIRGESFTEGSRDVFFFNF